MLRLLVSLASEPSGRKSPGFPDPWQWAGRDRILIVAF